MLKVQDHIFKKNISLPSIQLWHSPVSPAQPLKKMALMRIFILMKNTNHTEANEQDLGARVGQLSSLLIRFLYAICVSSPFKTFWNLISIPLYTKREWKFSRFVGLGQRPYHARGHQIKKKEIFSLTCPAVSQSCMLNSFPSSKGCFIFLFSLWKIVGS